MLKVVWINSLDFSTYMPWLDIHPELIASIADLVYGAISGSYIFIIVCLVC